MNAAPDAGGPLTRTLPGRFYHDPAIWQLEQERLFGRLWVWSGARTSSPPRATIGPCASATRASSWSAARTASTPRLPERLPPPRRPALPGRARARRARSSAAITPGPTASTAASCGAPDLRARRAFDPTRSDSFPSPSRPGRGSSGSTSPTSPRAARRPAQPASRSTASATPRHLQPLPVGTSRSADDRRTRSRANWKLVVENFMECYHCAPVHPELVPAPARLPQRHVLPGHPRRRHRLRRRHCRVHALRQRPAAPPPRPRPGRRSHSTSASSLWPNVLRQPPPGPRHPPHPSPARSGSLARHLRLALRPG